MTVTSSTSGSLPPTMTMPAGPTVGTGGNSTPTKRTTTVGKDEFMQLLVIQLKNQDPLSPMKPDDMAAQLAQFSSLEQLTQVNDQLKQQLGASAMNTLAVQSTLGASLIGKQVVTGGDLVEVTQGEPAKLLIDAPPGGGQTVVTFTDANGAVVATREIGAIGGGRQTLSVEEVPAGVHHFAVKVTGSNGTPVDASTFTSGVVDGIHFENGTLMVRMGRIKVPLDTLVEINPAPAAATASAALRSFFPITTSTTLREQVAP